MSALPDLIRLDHALRQAEVAIHHAVAAELAKIHEEFGMSPDRVSVYLTDVTAVGDKGRRVIVGEVRVGVSL